MRAAKSKAGNPSANHGRKTPPGFARCSPYRSDPSLALPAHRFFFFFLPLGFVPLSLGVEPFGSLRI